MPPTHWPDPPLLSHLLFENPWPLAFVLGTLAVGMFMVGGRRGRLRLQLAAAAPLLAALALPVAAHFVATDLERMRSNTRRLVAAVSSPFDLDTIVQLTTDDARLLHWNREQLIQAARSASEVVEITEYTVTNMMARKDGEGYGRTYVAVIGRGEYRGGGFAGGFKTRWLLNWRKEEDGNWRLSAVEEVEVNGRDAEDRIRGMVR